MQSQKRSTLEFYFLSSTKKPRNNEHETESSVASSSTLSSSQSQLENQDPASSFSLPVDQPLSPLLIYQPENQGPSRSSLLSVDQPSSPLSTLTLQYENPDSSRSSLLSIDQHRCSLNGISRKKTMPNDISMSFNDAPMQNRLSKYPMNVQNRSFQANWFVDRVWLEYSVQNDACYCYYCRHFSSNDLNSDVAFTITGFNNWKKALAKQSGLIKHASSQAHITATKNYLSFRQQQERNSNVLKQLDSSRVIQIRKNRDRLTKICSTLRLLARQMISFRGHDENEQCV